MPEFESAIPDGDAHERLMRPSCRHVARQHRHSVVGSVVGHQDPILFNLRAPLAADPESRDIALFAWGEVRCDNIALPSLHSALPWALPRAIPWALDAGHDRRGRRLGACPINPPEYSRGVDRLPEQAIGGSV